MAQPTLSGLTLNAGSGGSDLAHDVVDSKIWQAILVGYSTGDGTANVVMADTGLPVVPATGAVFSVQSNSANLATQATLATIDADTSSMASSLTTIAAAIGGEGSDKANGIQIMAVSGTALVDIIADADGHLQVDVLSGGGAGTQYTEADTDASITGTAILWEDAADTLRAVSATKPLPVDLGTNNDVTLATLPDTAAGDLASIDTEVQTHTTLLTTVDASLESLDTKIALCNTGSVVIASGTVTTVTTVTTVGAVTAITNALPAGDNNIGNVDVLTIAAGDNNIGNVDIVSLPAGNLGQQAMAASLSTVPANNITDATYIGDIKFGEALPAGTNAIGKLAANSGVDIGDVDVTSISAGTNTIGGVISQLSTSAAYDGTTSCTLKRVSGVAAGGAPGTDTMIAAVADKKIRILAIALFATDATTNEVYIYNGDNNLIGNSGNGIPMAVNADGDAVAGFVLPFNPAGWCQSDTANEAIVLASSAAYDIIYSLSYIEVT